MASSSRTYTRRVCCSCDRPICETAGGWCSRHCEWKFSRSRKRPVRVEEMVVTTTTTDWTPVGQASPVGEAV